MSSLLFDNLDELTASAIETQIENTIENSEPRVILIKVRVQHLILIEMHLMQLYNIKVVGIDVTGTRTHICPRLLPGKMPLVNFSNVDFDQIKQSITDYLRSNSNFTDYDFEGSNLSTIIDLLAYNTYITSYNANMVTNEVFIDSATLRENVVSLARNIGYVPRSRKAAKAIISFNVDLSDTNIVSATLKSRYCCNNKLNQYQTKFYIFNSR